MGTDPAPDHVAVRELWVDASWQSGRAGIAVATMTGRTIASHLVETDTPAEAEFRAVRLAKKIATDRNWLPVRIFTDFTSATHPANTGRQGANYQVKWRPRNENQAHLEARRILKMAR